MTSTLETLNKTETYYPKSSTKGVDYLEISKSDRNRQRLLEHQIDQKLHLLNRVGYAVEIVENSRNISIAQVLEFNKLCTYLATLNENDFQTIANKIGWFRVNNKDTIKTDLFKQNNKNSIQALLEKFNSLKLNIDDKNASIETTTGPTFANTYEEKVTVVKPTMLRDVSTNVNEMITLQRDILENTPKNPDFNAETKQESVKKNQDSLINKLNKFWKSFWS